MAITLDVAKRHYVSSEETLKQLVEYIPRFHEIADRAHGREDMRVQLRLRLSAPATAAKSLEEPIEDALREIKKAGWETLYDAQGESAGSKFVRQLFPRNPQPDTILSLCCLDQYPLHEEDQFEAFLDLAAKTHRDGTAYANGSRSVPVVLGAHGAGHELRTAHELIHSISAQGRFVTQPQPWTNPSPWYVAFGESTSGAYFTNPQGKAY